MSGAEILVEATKKQGVDSIFFLTGGAILPAGDALGNSDIKIIEVLHEGMQH